MSHNLKFTTDTLQRVMNAAARVVSDTRKYDSGLTYLLHDELHWPDVPEHVQSCVQRSTDVCSTRHRSTWRTSASTPQSLLVGSTCGPPAAVGCSYHNTDVRCSVAGPFLWPARWPGTRYQTVVEIRYVLWQFLLWSENFSFLVLPVYTAH